MSYETPERLCSLSKPRLRTDSFHMRKEYQATDRDPTNSGVYNLGVLKHEPSERLKQLAIFKGGFYGNPDEENCEKIKQHAFNKRNYQYPGAPFTQVPQSARKFEATDRLRSMSAPKLKNEFHVRKEFSDRISDPKNSGVYKSSVLKAEATDRVRELSKHKGEYKNYIFAKPVMRNVTTATKNFQTTERLTELCVPFGHKISQKFVRIA